MAYTVGQVEVDVLPNARRFQEELGRQITPKARKVAEDVGDELSKQAAQGLTKGLKEGGKNASTQGEQVGGSFASGFQKRLKAALESLPDATVRLNVADTAQLDRLRAELTALSSKRIGIDISAEDAEAKVLLLQSQLAELGRKSSHVQLRVDTAQASAELAKFRGEVAAAGNEDGSILSEGIRQAAVRRSPLIVAAISGGLIAGAPAVLAAGTLLFGGIAAAAVHSNEQVHAAAVNLANDTLGVFRDAAQVTVPTFVAALKRIDVAVQSLGPQLHSAFGALAGAGGPIDSLTTGIINLAHNAMPGLVAVVQSATPVFQGLASFLGSIGTGVSDFLTILSQHGPAAGQVFSSLGTIVQELLPALGELIGAGVELAKTVLPPVAAALGLVNTVLHAIAPVLPEILAGLIGFKAISLLSGPLDLLSAKLQTVAADAEGMALKVSGRAAQAVSGFASSLPAVGLALGALAFAYQAAQQSSDDFANAIVTGGASARQAQADFDAIRAGLGDHGGLVGAFLDATGAGAGLNYTLDQSQTKANALAANLTPLQVAQQNATTAQDNLTQAVKTYGINSPQAVTAAAAYQGAQAEVARQAALTSGAIDGITQAMIDQANQELAATSSSFAYRQAQDNVQTAENNLKAAIIAHGQASEAARDATLQLEEALFRQAAAAGKLAADALPATASAQDRNTAAAQGTLAELYKLRDQYGTAFPASLQTTITNLEQTGVHVDTTSGQFALLGDAVNSVPVFHGIHVDADLGPAEAKLSAFINKHWTAIIDSTVQGSGTTGGGGTKFRLARGGPILGPGTGTSDSIPILASNGEFMVNAKATAQNRAVLEAINAGRFADGGYVNSRDWTSVLYDADMSGANAGITAAQKMAGAFVASALPKGGAGGAARWASVVLQSLAMIGQPSSLLATVLRRMNQESGGNQFAINLWDSNAKRGTPSKGLMQVIDPTFRSFHDPRSSWNIYDPLANLLASERYAIARYGSLSAAYNKAGGYAMGTNYVPRDGLYNLHQGEAVVPAAANAGWKQPNLTVIAQFGTDTIEAISARVLDAADDDLTNGIHYGRG